MPPAGRRVGSGHARLQGRHRWGLPLSACSARRWQQPHPCPRPRRSSCRQVPGAPDVHPAGRGAPAGGADVGRLRWAPGWAAGTALHSESAPAIWPLPCPTPLPKHTAATHTAAPPPATIPTPPFLAGCARSAPRRSAALPCLPACPLPPHSPPPPQLHHPTAEDLINEAVQAAFLQRLVQPHQFVVVMKSVRGNMMVKVVQVSWLGGAEDGLLGLGLGVG